MKGGKGFGYGWGNTVRPRKVSRSESSLEDSDMRYAKRRQGETNKLAKVVFIRDIYNNYILKNKTIDEFKKLFRPEGNLGSEATILFNILNDNKNYIKNGKWDTCIKLIDELYKYKESFITLKDEDDSPPSSPTSEPNSRGQLRKKKKRTKNKKHKMRISSRSVPKSMSKMERRSGKVKRKKTRMRTKLKSGSKRR